MNENAALEARIGRLFDAYADQAAVEVDPLAMARLAAAGGHTRRAFRLPFWPARVGLLFALLGIAALTVVGGTLLAGSTVRDPEPAAIPGERVEPFLGLPPLGAAASGPERGDLELSFGGRIPDRGFDRVWVYADGRLIWLWENPSSEPSQGATPDALGR